jgi:DNA mismatch repair protein PMS2
MVAIENLDVLQKNGFEVILEDDEESEDSQGSRLKLTATPISKNTVFDMKGKQSQARTHLLASDLRSL